MFNDNQIIRRGIAQENAVLEKLFKILFKVVDEIPSSTEERSTKAVFRARKLTEEAAFVRTVHRRTSSISARTL